MHAPANSGAAWQDLVRENARTLRKLTEAHPTLVLHLVSNPRDGAAAALEANEALFGAVVRAGFTPRVVLRAADLVVDHVNGFALGEAGGPVGGAGRARVVPGAARSPARR